MRTLLALGLAVATFEVSAADDKKDPTAGKWVVESVTRDGKSNDALKGAVREHSDGKYTFTPAAGSKAQPTTGTYVIDTTKSPIAIDIKPKGGTYDGKTLVGHREGRGRHVDDRVRGAGQGPADEVRERCW